MRHLLVMSLIMLVLATACCGGGDTGDARLVAIDSLTAAAPDSALTLLAAIDTAALDESDRAYHALLTAQAAYKAYRPATDSALIARARRHYAHGGSHDRRLRTMLYSGTTAEELGDPEQAMRWYKQAEDFAHRDEHSVLGDVTMSKALIYQNEALNRKNAIENYRRAIRHFEAIGDSTKLLFCLTEEARLQQLYDLDTAKTHILKALDLATTLADTMRMIENRVNLVSCYFERKDYANVLGNARILLAFDGINEDQRRSCVYYICHSFADLLQLDSAKYYLAQMPAPECTVDSVMMLRARAEVAKVSGNLLDYVKLDSLSTELSEHMVDASSHSPINHIETEMTINSLKRTLGVSGKHTRLVIVLLIISVLVGLVAYVVSHRRNIAMRHRHEQAQKQIQEEKRKSEQQLKSEKKRVQAMLHDTRNKSQSQLQAERRKAEEKLQAERRKADERLQAEIGKAEETLQTEMGKAEERLQTERGKAEERLQAERRKAEERLQAEKGKAEERLQTEMGKAEERLQTERKKAEERLQAERSEAEAKLQAESENNKKRLQTELQRLEAQLEAEFERAKQQHDTEIANLRELLHAERRQIDELERVNAEKYKAYAVQQESMRVILDLLLHAAPRGSSSLRSDLKKTEIGEQLMLTLRNSVDVLLDGFVGRLVSKYGCSTASADLFCLCFCGAGNNIIELCTPYKMQTIANMKQRIAHRVLGKEATWQNLIDTLLNRPGEY